WFAQESPELIHKKINYLKEKTKNLKGIKLNFNDVFLCRLESVFSKGDRRLNSLIEEVHKKAHILMRGKNILTKKYGLKLLIN
ncbi:MAG: hypothetical protein KAQ92_04245, partial [Candidatus Aenigmarchaeota archaeon]|nr:hypothetical protein [Candidatus Aenigmarchaeota archaeon]